MEELQPQEQFEILCEKITGYLQYPNKRNWVDIQSDMLEINKLDFRTSIIIVNSAPAQILLLKICEDDDLMEVAGLDDLSIKLVESLIVWQGIKVEGKPLKLICEWCIKVFKHKNEHVAFRAFTIFEHLSRKTPNSGNQFLNMSCKMCNSVIDKTPHIKMKFAAFSLLYACLEKIDTSIVTDDLEFKSKNMADKFDKCGQLFIEYLVTFFPFTEENFDYKVKIVRLCLKGLQKLLTLCNDFLKKRMDTLMNICKRYMLFGLVYFEHTIKTREVAQNNQPSVSSSTNLQEKRGGKTLKTKKHKPLDLSTEDLSKSPFDIDDRFPLIDQFTTNLSFIEWKELHSNFESKVISFKELAEGEVRKGSLNLLLCIFQRLEKVALFRYWNEFVSDKTTQSLPDLTYCILYDQLMLGKILSLNVLYTLLLNSKPFLKNAQNILNSNFTSYSEILALGLINLHTCLVLVLKSSERKVLLITLKCLSVLAQATPYDKLNDSHLLLHVIWGIKPLLDHADPNVAYVALVVINTVAMRPFREEVRVAFSSYHPSEPTEHTAASGYEVYSLEENGSPELLRGKSWLITRCLTNLHPGCEGQNLRGTTLQIKVETLQLVASLAANYFEKLLFNEVEQFSSVLLLCLKEKSPDLSLHACKTAEFIGQALSDYVKKLHIENKVKEHDDALDTCHKYWINLVETMIEIMMSSDDLSLVANLCSCLNTINMDTFVRHMENNHTLILQGLLQCSCNKDPNVQAAAIGTLGTFVLNTTFPLHSKYLAASFEALQFVFTESGNNTGLIEKASWTMANLSNVMFNLYEKDPLNVMKIKKLIKWSTTMCMTTFSDKTRANAIRSSGYLLCFIQEDLFNMYGKMSIKLLLENLIMAKNPKIKWNVSHAFGEAFKGTSIYSDMNVVWEIYDDLLLTLKNSTNYKVQKSVVYALSCPTNRKQYTCYFVPIYIAMIEALEMIQVVESASGEEEHRRDLLNTIMFALAHLTSLITPADVGGLENFVHDRLSWLRRHVEDMIMSHPSEHLTNFYKAVNQLQGIREMQPRISENLLVGLQLFEHIFRIDDYRSLRL